MRPARTAGRESDRQPPLELVARFAADVQYYLAQEPPQLPSRYLYDDLGSALFEAICHLPWYTITRAERRLLRAHAAAIFRELDPLATVVELGSGSGDKLALLLDEAGINLSPARVHLVDLSAAALADAQRRLQRFDHVRITTHQAAYEDGLAVAAQTFVNDDRALVLFLGSNIGNFDPPGAAALLRSIRRQLRVGDSLLLGTDLVKPEPMLRAAYDDPLGVTAAFNLNLLVRVNRELGGTFAIEEFAHRAVWNAAASRVEMHLVARTPQEVRIELSDTVLTLDTGESIWTESSYKYRLDDVSRLLRGAGLAPTGQWTDEADLFGLTLAQAV